MHTRSSLHELLPLSKYVIQHRGCLVGGVGEHDHEFDFFINTISDEHVVHDLLNVVCLTSVIYKVFYPVSTKKQQLRIATSSKNVILHHFYGKNRHLLIFKLRFHNTFHVIVKKIIKCIITQLFPFFCCWRKSNHKVCQKKNSKKI